MNPTTEIIYNYDYAKRLYRGEENFEDVWQNILARGAAFEKIHEKIIELVLSAIEKYSGFAWKEYAGGHLPVYLAEIESSFADPLTLAAQEDPEKMLEDFIWQLAYRNMRFGFTTEELRQRCLNAITGKVLSDLGIREDSKLCDIKLKEKTIKQYLNK